MVLRRRNKKGYSWCDDPRLLERALFFSRAMYVSKIPPPTSLISHRRKINSIECSLRLYTLFPLPSLPLFPPSFSLPLVTMEEGIKVHTKGRVQHGASTDVDGDYFFFKGGSTGVIKILEPMNPLLNYYEYIIVNKGREASIGIGVRQPLAVLFSSVPSAHAQLPPSHTHTHTHPQ